MKQILIESNKTIGQLYGKRIVLNAGKDTVTFVSKQVTTLNIPLDLKPISGKGTFDLLFQPSEQLARSGVALLGAYFSGNEVVASFISLKDGHNVEVDKDTPVLIGTLFEPVSYRQIEMTVAGGTVNVVKSQEGQGVSITPTPTKKRQRKKN